MVSMAQIPVPKPPAVRTVLASPRWPIGWNSAIPLSSIARPAREGLDHALPPSGRERALCRRALHRLGGHRARPVELADDVTGAQADGVAVLPQRAEIDLAGELGDLRARHADAEIAASDPEPLGPRVVEHLRPAGKDPADEDVLGARDVPHEPRQ
jgi:hypothetical protein